MRVAVISDIHSNLPALQAVLADVGSHDPDQVWCLGDIVGYGAHPDACTELVSEVVEVCLAGNHDLVVRGDIDIRYFAMSAGAAARWTVKKIRDDTREFLAGLAPLGPDRGRRPVPRQPARPGLGVRPLGHAGGRVPGRPAAARLPDRPLPRRLLLRAQRRRDRRPPGGRRRRRRDGVRRVAGEPRQRGAAARRRPARGVADARHGEMDGDVPARRVSDRRGRPRDHRRGAAHGRSPTGCIRASSTAGLGPLALPQPPRAPISSFRMPPVRPTRRRRRTLGAAAALALAAGFVSSCGEDSNTGLSQQRASNLRSSLDQVETRVERPRLHRGGRAGRHLPPAGRFASLAGGPRPAGCARASATRLETLVADQCEAEPAAPVEEPPTQEPTVTDENAGDQQDKGKKDKKPKKQKDDQTADRKEHRGRTAAREGSDRSDRAGRRRRRAGGRRVAMAVLGLEIAGRYRLDERLGAGGMSTVYRARDNVLERQVAVKLLAEHLSEDDGLRGAVPAGGARGREAGPPQRRPGVRLRTRPGGAPPLHRDGVRRGADRRAADAGARSAAGRRRPSTSPCSPAKGSSTRTGTA